MSTITNDRLLEEAAQLLDYWEGTLWADVIKKDVESGDLESLSAHVTVATREMLIKEYNPEQDCNV